MLFELEFKVVKDERALVNVMPERVLVFVEGQIVKREYHDGLG